MSDQSLFKLVSNSVGGAFRVGQTAQVLAGTGINWMRGNRPPAPKLLRQTFEKMGATYIKLGQFIASSPTFFPEEYVLEFQNCLDSAPPIRFRQIKSVIEAELGGPLSHFFAEFDPEPLATASIAQVHTAKLRTGEDVVVKVQKPGVHQILLTDFNFLLLSSKILEYFMPNLTMASLSEITSELQSSMLDECDFVKEANNIAEFQEFLQTTMNTEVLAPKVYPEFSGNKVLTMERFHGVAFTDLDSIKEFSVDPQQTLITAMNTWFASLLMAKSFHADLHAGNLMVLENGKIAYIDFGIVGRISPDTWTAIAEFMQAITFRDFGIMAKAMVGIGVTKGDINIDAMATDIEKLYRSMDGSMGGSESDTNKLMVDMVGIGKRYGIHFPREFALLLKQILYFDRYVQLMAPNSDFYADNRLVMTADLLSD